MKGWKDEGKWRKAARELNFSAEQRKRVLVAREEALATLNQCALTHHSFVTSLSRWPTARSVVAPRRHLCWCNPKAGATNAGELGWVEQSSACCRTVVRISLLHVVLLTIGSIPLCVRAGCMASGTRSTRRCCTGCSQACLRPPAATRPQPPRRVRWCAERDGQTGILFHTRMPVESAEWLEQPPRS